MLKNLKKVAAIVLSFAMAVQFGLADSYYVNAVEEPVEPQQEETTTTAPQEQEEVPTTEEETPQQQEEEEPQPAAEEAQPQPQPQPVEQAEVKVSYVKEDGTDLMESVTATYDVGYRLDQDTNVFKEAHEAFEFEYAFVNGNKENKITKDQVKASGLTVTSDMTSLTLVYKEKASTEKPKKANEQEPAKTETTSESDDASDADTTESQETAVQLTEFFVVASQNQVTKGETAQLTLTIKPDNYPNKDVTWSSSNEATATVDENGLVTTHEVGTVTITATLKSDPAISSSATIVVNPIKVSKITVNGYGKDYLVKGNTVTLTTTVEPSDAANKSIVWSSSNEEVATVDQNGKVTAVGQGTVSIKAMNDDSGVYGEQVITVYDNTPANYKVHVYVTNENQKTTYTINIPKDGTVVTPASVAQNTTGNGRTLVTKAEIRVLDELGSQPNWANISSKPIVTAFRYYNGKLQYKTTSNSAWATVGSNQRIYDFSNIQYKADETGSYNSTDVKVTIGDWPYGANASTSEIYKTIQIQVYNNETKKNVYDSGVMRYANGSNGNYGKVNFICDTSKYEVVKVERYFSNTSSSNYGSADTVYEGTIPSDLSVQFTSNNSYYYYTPTHEHYKFIAYVQAKTIHVKYDANNGTGAPKGTTVKSTEKVTVDSTTRPTREGYIFTGWAYGGKLYQGGESFDAPISDVTFVAQWAKASDVINYTVNDSKMGSVSRSYERIGETVQGNVQGSTAIAKTGYQFVKWVKGTNPDGDAVSTDVEYKPTIKGTYMAVFEAVKSDLVVRYVEDTTDGKEISASETKSYKYGESYTVTAKDIKGYRLKSESPITGTKGVAREEITFVYTKKEGKVIYNLGPKGSWGNGSPENVVVFDAAKGKWAYNYGFDKGDTFVVTDSVPTSSDNAVFVGWYDKERGTTPAAMRTAGEKVTYPYTESSKTNTYTLDALWEKLQGTNKELPYDGKKHSLDEFTVKFANDNLQGWTDSASSLVQASNIQYRLKQNGKEVNEWGAMPSFKDAGTYTIVAKATVNGVELTAEATLTINPRAVTLKSADLDKEYDGKALVNGEKALATEEGWAEGEGATYNFTGSQTVVGSSANAFTYTLNEGTNADNYTINKTEGKLTVKDRKEKYAITVKAKDGTATYDGKDHTVSGFEATPFEVNGNKYTVTGLSASVTGKAAGKYTSKVTGKAVVKDAAGNNVTKQFTVNTENGSLVINRKKYTVETLDGNKTYDGIPLTAGAKINGIIEGEVVYIKTTKSLTDVGSIPNDKYELTWETAKATNYKLDGEKFGTLTVTVQSIDPGTDPEKPNPDYTGAKVNSPSDKVYDGKEHKWSPTVTDKADKKLEAGTDYTVEYSTSDFTNVGTIKVTITGKGNYTGTVTRTYKITPKSVTVTAEDKTKVFGETDPELMAKVAGTLGKDTVDYTLSREAGEAAGKYTITPSGKAEQGNYSVTYATGTLTITSQSIDPGTDPENPNPDYTGAKVNSPSDAVYDGNEHKWIPTVTDKADKKLKAGTDYTVEYSTKNFKDVGTVEVTITGKGNYTGTVTRTYKITPKSVTVAANDKTKVFGETDPKLTATVAGTLGNDTVDYKLSRKDGEAVGKYAITASGKAEQGNYTVTYATGTLTITSQSIDPGTDPEKPNPDYTGAKVNSPKDSVYDGKEHKWSPTVTDKTKTLELGKDYTVEYSTSDFTNVGTIEVVITGIGNYSGTVKRSYKVTPREYTVTTESATKTYSGTALTAGGKVEGIVSGETVEFTTTGSQTEVGTSKNTYELVWKSAKATNYTLVKESIGKLTVKAKSIVPDDKDTPESEKTGITVSEPSDSKYDGKEHKEVLTVTDTKTGKELVAGTDYSVTYSSDLVNAGTVKVTVAGLGNYSGSFTKTYKITKRSVTLASATVSKVYDGSALTNTSITVSGDGFVEGEGASYEVTGSQTVVGNSANSFEYKLNEKTLASNYNITKVVGTLTITAAPAPVTPTTPSTPSSTTSTTPRTPSAPQVTTPAETVEKETTPKAEPKKEEKVEEEYTPKASPQYYWALINLICAILTVLFGLLLLISKRHKDEDDDEEDDETKQQTNNDDEEKEQEKKRGLFTRVLAVLIAIVSVVFFLVTEDLSLPWTWTDQWTIWMVVIGLVQIVVFFVGRKWKNVDDDEDEEEAQQA